MYTHLRNSSSLSQLSPCLPFLQVIVSSQPVKQTTFRTRATARSLPAPASVRWTPCRLQGPTTVAAAATGRPPGRRCRRPPWSLTSQRRQTHTPMLTTASRAPGNWTSLQGNLGGGESLWSIFISAHIYRPFPSISFYTG